MERNVDNKIIITSDVWIGGKSVPAGTVMTVKEEEYILLTKQRQAVDFSEAALREVQKQLAANKGSGSVIEK